MIEIKVANCMRMSTIAGVWFFLTSTTFAGEDSDRLADYVSPTFLESASLSGLVADAAISDTIIARRTAKTDIDRWIQFEREYGIQTPEPTWVLGVIQAAKFELDKLTFGAKETARKLEFTYDLGRSPGSGPHALPERNAYSLPLFGTFGQPQLRSVITEHEPAISKAFVGLKLQVSFGQGAAEYR